MINRILICHLGLIPKSRPEVSRYRNTSHTGGFHTQLLSSNTVNKVGVTSNENLKFACQKQLAGFGPFSFIVLVKQHCQYLINGPFLRRSCWQELCPRTKAKMNFFCRRKVSPDTTLALAPCSSENKRGCAGSGGRPEAALPQLSLQAVRSFWHQPYFTSTIIYCRQYPADGDCLFLLFFLAFLQAGGAGSDRQTACSGGERQICLHLIVPRGATSKKTLKI